VRLLIDSNVLLWSFSDRKRLTPKVLQLIEDDTNDLIVSQASIWEIAIKVAKGTLMIPGSSVRSLLDQIEMTGMSILSIENSHILRMEKLPFHHRDPFDRIIVAQAIEEGLPILASDEDIPLYAVTVIWK
jgi:PIN domain nuclease of toxin-antitoxin system